MAEESKRERERGRGLPSSSWTCHSLLCKSCASASNPASFKALLLPIHRHAMAARHLTAALAGETQRKELQTSHSVCVSTCWLCLHGSAPQSGERSVRRSGCVFESSRQKCGNAGQKPLTTPKTCSTPYTTRARVLQLCLRAPASKDSFRARTGILSLKGDEQLLCSGPVPGCGCPAGRGAVVHLFRVGLLKESLHGLRYGPPQRDRRWAQHCGLWQRMPALLRMCEAADRLQAAGC